MNHILEQEDGKNRFLKAVMELSKAFALSVPHGKAMQIRDEVGFFQVVRSQIVKYTPVSGVVSEGTDSAIRQIVSEAISSKGVMDIFDTRIRKTRSFPFVIRQISKRTKRDEAEKSCFGAST